MSNRPARSLARRVLPAFVITSASAGLIALLDKPSSGSAGDLGGPLDGASTAAGEDRSALPGDGSGGSVQPPAVSSTLPVSAGDDEAEADEGDDGEDDDGTPIAPAQPADTQPAQPSASTVPVPGTPAATGACEGSTVDGPSVNTRWGPVQVEAVVSATGQICDVTAIRSPDSHRRSVSINQQALPILHDQVLEAQSADVNGVSGATVTSEAYVRSLQAILDGGG